MWQKIKPLRNFFNYASRAIGLIYLTPKFVKSLWSDNTIKDFMIQRCDEISPLADKMPDGSIRQNMQITIKNKDVIFDRSIWEQAVEELPDHQESLLNFVNFCDKVFNSQPDLFLGISLTLLIGTTALKINKNLKRKREQASPQM